MAIVKNEGPNIERCLDSIKNIATSYMICDTGSTDDTVPKIESYMAKAGIPGEVIHKEWQNYGFNRSYLAWKAQNHHLCGKAKYLCWLDADEVYLMDPANHTSYPTKEDADRLFKYLEKRAEPIFYAMTHYGNLKYLRWQFCRNNQVVMWRLPYQEYFKAEKDERVHVVDFIYNFARHEGNSSRDPKITQKRIDMTENWMKLGIGANITDSSGFIWPGPREEDVPRINFYLGEAYKCVDTQMAIFYYKKRLQNEGYVQEKYISLIDLHKLVKDDYEKVAHLIRAIELFPKRLEAPYYLMMHYMGKQEFRKAAAMGALASDNRVADQQDLFVEPAIYTYLFDLNYSVCCCYGGQEQLAYKIGKELFEKKPYPAEMEQKVHNNLKVFFEKLPRGGLEIPSGLKVQNKLSPELPEIFVIDEFYDEPLETRKFALEQEYESVQGYPGKKSQGFPNSGVKEVLEKVLQKEIKYWPDTNGQFQYVTKKGLQRMTRDHSDYTAIVFMLPNAPQDKGLVFYRHKTTGSEEGPEKEFSNESQWEVVDRVANKFNRGVVFKGKRNHKYEYGLGNSLETGALVQVFHFNL